LFSVLIVLGTSPAASVSVRWIPQRVVVKGARAQQIGIRASHVRRGIVCWFRRHQLLFGGDRVSISEQR